MNRKALDAVINQRAFALAEARVRLAQANNSLAQAEAAREAAEAAIAWEATVATLAADYAAWLPRGRQHREDARREHTAAMHGADAAADAARSAHAGWEAACLLRERYEAEAKRTRARHETAAMEDAMRARVAAPRRLCLKERTERKEP
jgi:hypothetical protein